MITPSLGHLEHLDEDAPYIAYVRFEDAGEGNLNKAYKPVELFKLLMERYADITII